MKNKKKLIKTIAADISLYLLGMGIFLMFHYIMPYSLESGRILSDTVFTDSFSLPEKSEDSEKTANTDISGIKEKPSDKSETSEQGRHKSRSSDSESKTPPERSSDSESSSESRHRSDSEKSGGRSGRPTGNTDTTEISSDKNISAFENFTSETVASERTDNADITINKCSFGTGDDKVTYYLADIYVTSAEAVKTAFADDTYGKNIRSSVSEMAENSGALLAISGDYYGNSEDGVVIRNGVLYRSNPTNADVCVLFSDGTLKTYSPDEFDADEVISQGAWQAWTFGPSLLDGNGNISGTFNSNSYINGNNPRCAIGIVSAGHYVFAVVDGRDKGYSRGVTLTELARIMSDAGCTYAYNLDGGKSSAMYYNGGYISSPADGGRDISDIIYIG